jgi:hypothetical protein
MEWSIGCGEKRRHAAGMALPTDTATGNVAPQPPLKLLPKPGRPSLFCPERTAAICALIEQEVITGFFARPRPAL